ncbi:MAG: hypothetical protein J3K34DRAFT_125497 [Monoraphidium minutum]|nr:MAG: hypothetical protein J3K34DRAFT_125497 [Monoraphidium minutum]
MQLIGADLKQGAAAATARVHACVSTGPTGPFVASVAIPPPGGRCAPGAAQVPFNLNSPIPGAPALFACVSTTPSPAGALRALRVAFASPGGDAPPACGAGFAAQPGDANAGAGGGGLSAVLCGSTRDQGLISKSLDPSVSAGESTVLVHPLSEGLFSCLTVAGGAAMAARRGVRVAPWPCKGAPPAAQQQWVFAPKGGGKLQIQTASSRLCLSSLNGEGSLVYTYDCQTSAADRTAPLPWQLWSLEPVPPRSSGAVVAGGGGVYRIRAAAGGWCMQAWDEPADYYDDEGDNDMSWVGGVTLAQCSTSDPRQHFALEAPGAPRLSAAPAQQPAPAPAPAPAPQQHPAPAPVPAPQPAPQQQQPAPAHPPGGVELAPIPRPQWPTPQPSAPQPHAAKPGAQPPTSQVHPGTPPGDASAPPHNAPPAPPRARPQPGRPQRKPKGPKKPKEGRPQRKERPQREDKEGAKERPPRAPKPPKAAPRPAPAAGEGAAPRAGLFGGIQQAISNSFRQAASNIGRNFVGNVMGGLFG